MNKTFRSVWNASKQAYVAAAETVSARGKPCSSSKVGSVLAGLFGGLLTLGAFAQTPPPPNALPTGGKVSAGQASISQSGANMVIQQGSDRAAINWQTFNVGSNAQVQFQQPSASSVTLNRVMSADPSQIFGRISANGQVILTNPSGVYFGASARVDVGGIIATTHGISDADFMAGKNRFERNGSTGGVINEGELKAALGGYIALLAPEVRNQGAIIAQMGTVALAAGEAIDLHFDSNNRLTSIRVEPSQIKALVDNRYAVEAPGGLIILSAQSMDRLIGGVVRNSGRVEASGLQQQGGRIILAASKTVENTGSISANATAGATAAESGPAGKIEISAADVLNSGTISAVGNILQSAGNAFIQATNVSQAASGRIDLSAPQQGGTLSIQTTGRTQLQGQVNASATQEVSSRGGQIDIQAQGDMDVMDATLNASGGEGGQIRLRAAADQQPNNPNPLPSAPDAPGQGRLAIMGNSSLSVRGRQGRGGNATLLGERISLRDNTAIDATGATGGGKVLVGGDWQGSNGVYQATTVTMAVGVSIDASATQQGVGGTVVLWSDVNKADSVTAAQGSVFAKGGTEGGNGGQIETSGHMLQLDGIRVDASAAQGAGGEWLLDPYNITISASENSSVSNSSYTYTSNSTSSNINVSTITNALNSGTSVTVQTGAGGSEIGDIQVNAAISKTGGTDATLTLKAHNNVVVSSTISSSNSQLHINLLADSDKDGAGIVIINSNLSSNGGNIAFGDGSKITFGGVENIQVGGDVYVTGGSAVTWATGGGSLTVNGQTLIGNASGLSINTSNGAVTFKGSIDSANQYTSVYESAGITWTNALTAAQSGGGTASGDTYLATVTSRLENSIASQTVGYKASWLGGRRVTGSGSDTIWRWMTGPEAAMDGGKGLAFSQQNTSSSNAASGATSVNGYFNNWSTGEPNNWNGSAPGAISSELESVLQFTGSLGKWNDLPKTGYNLNYYVKETNAQPSPLTINAGTGALLIQGGVGSSKALASLNVTSGSTTINGNGLITTGAQTYSSGLTVAAGNGNLMLQGTTITAGGATNATGASINLNANLAGASAITLQANTTDVLIDGAITNTADSATSLNIQAARHIRLGSNASITSSAAAMTTQLWADNNADGDGIVYITSSGIDTKGGDLTFGQNGKTASIGGQSVLVGGDVFFQRASAQTLRTGGGALNVYGETIVANISGLTINTNNGNVNLYGLVNSGNAYDFVTVTSGGSWDAARTSAKNGTAGGSATGDSYLVTITSRLENSIAGLAANYKGAWIGAYRPDTNSYAWTWADGPEAGKTFFTQSGSGGSGGGTTTAGYYSNFGAGEPNGGLNSTRTSTESVGQFFGSAGQWNDLNVNTAFSSTQSNQYAVLGYVRETNLAASPVNINAGTGALLIQGGVGSSKALASLTVTASNSTVNGNGLVTTGAQTYSSALTANAGSNNLLLQGTTITAGGAVSASGANINLNVNLTSTPSGAAIVLQATGSIDTANNPVIATNNGNVSIIADSDANGSGTLYQGGLTVNPGSGNVLIRAEYIPAETSTINGSGTLTVESSDASFSGGVAADWFTPASTLTGLSIGKASNTYDVYVSANKPLSIAGAIAMQGNVIYLNDNVTSTTTGDMLFFGNALYPGNPGWSFKLAPGKTITKSAGAGTLTIQGNGRINDGVNTGSIQATGTAKLNVVMISEMDGGNNFGVSTGNITTNGGDVWIGGGAKTGTWNGLAVGSGPATATSGSGNSIDLTGNISTNGGEVMLRAAGTNSLVLDADRSISAGSGNISLLANQVGGGKYLTIGTAGVFTYAPESAGWDNNIGGSLNVTGSVVSNIFTGFSDIGWLKINNVSNLGGLVLGKEGNTSGVSMDSSWSIAGPISLYGANIGINANLTSTLEGAAILAKTTDAIVQSASVAVTTSGGSVTYWADSDNNGTGNILLSAGTSASNTSITTSGGAITLGGGTDPLTGYAKGANTTGADSFGVNLAGYGKLNAGTGAISLRGLTTETKGNYGIGVRLIDSSSLIGGNISITGIGSANTGGYGNNWGVSMEGSSTIVASGALAITGTGGGGNSSAGGNHGIYLYGATLTSSGDMTLTGTGGGKSSGGTGNKGVYVFGGSTLLSGAGTMTLVGTAGYNGSSEGITIAGGIGQTNTLGSATSGAQTGAIKLLANSLWFNPNNTNQVLGTSSLIIAPLSTSFSSAFSTSGLTVGSDFTGITLGKNGNTANITIASGYGASIAGPITVYGGAIAINGALTASSSDVNLHATGVVTQNAAITASGLGLHGTGTFALANTGNSIVTLAAGSSTERISDLSFVDADGGLTVGTVNPTGIWAVGEVKIETLRGDLTLSESINTLSTSASAVVLNAGKSTAAGTSTGGDVKVSGSPTITTGTGGRATIYTGSLSDSTGVVTSTADATDGLVTYGSGRFRYGSDESVANYGSALGSGTYVVYRERPTVTITADSHSITYGDSPALTASAAGGTLVNGDLLSNAVPSSPVAMVYNADNTATVAASDNGTAYYDVGTYTLRPGSLPTTSSLGYALTAANGTLTVDKKTLQVVAKDDAKFVGYTDTGMPGHVGSPGYAGVAYSGFAPGEDISQVNITNLAVTRTNKGADTAKDPVGSYPGVLQAAGLTSSNYTFDYVNGRYDIVDVNTLLVRVSDSTMTYAGQMPTLNLSTSSASYISSSGGVVVPMSWDADNNRWTDNTNTATWNYGLSSPNVGVRNITLNNFATSAALLTGAVVTGAVTVTPQTLSLSANKEYDGSLSLGSGSSGVTQTGSVTLGNVVSGETLTYSAAYANNKDVLTASKYITAITIGDGVNGLAGNYQLPSLASAVANVNSVSITPRALTASASKTYDGSNVVTASTTLGNLVMGESLTINNATLSSAHVASNTTNFINSLSLANGSGLVSNYALPSLTERSESNAASITARPIQVSLVNTNVSKVYDGSDAAKVGDGSAANAAFVPLFEVSNGVAGDALVISNTSAAYNSANVVNATALTATGLSIASLSATTSASQTSDYSLLNTSASVDASITPRAVAVSGSNVSKVYDGTTAMNGVSIGFAAVSGKAESGVIAGQSLTVSGGTGSFSSANAGTGKTYSLSGFTLSAGAGTDVRNYSLPGGGSSVISGSDGVIYKRPLNVTFTGDTRAYDGTTDATVTLTYGNGSYAPVEGDDVQVNYTAAYSSKNVGTSVPLILNVSGLSGVVAGNYHITEDALQSPVVGGNAGSNSATASGQITQRDSVTWVGGEFEQLVRPTKLGRHQRLGLEGGGTRSG